MADFEIDKGPEPGVTMRMGDGVVEGSESEENISMEVPEGEKKPEESKKADQDGSENTPAADTDDDADREDDDGAGEEDQDEEVTLEDLGEFNPEDQDKWDAQYRTSDGELNQDALSQEFFANADSGKDGLNEGTYAYLASAGISKAFAKQVESALLTQRDATKNAASQADMELMTLAGGPEALKGALEWGKDGGYDKAAQARFNKVMDGKDDAAKKEAVELLMARHAKATAKPPKNKKPNRDVTKGAGVRKSGPKAFSSKAEWQKAKADAGDNQEKLKEVARRYRASNL